MSGIAGLAVGAGVKMIAGRALVNAKADIAAIPPKAKLAIAGVLLLVVLFFVHQHIVHKALKRADQAGYDRAKSEDRAQLAEAHRQAIAARERAQAIGAQISRDTQEKNNAEARNIARDAGDLRLRGPGQASCRPVDHPGLPAGGGGPGPAGRAGDVAVARLPDQGGVELIALPFPGAVAFGEVSDLNRSEVLSWRAWYDLQFKAWEQMRKGKADGR
jgi:hypothetical protein